jgi:hypothetical protein
LNAVQPGLGLRAREVRKRPQGHHTTVVPELLPLEGGGYVADTPGLGRSGCGHRAGDRRLLPEIRLWCRSARSTTARTARARLRRDRGGRSRVDRPRALRLLLPHAAHTGR